MEAARIERRVWAALDIKSRKNFYIRFRHGSARDNILASFVLGDVLELNGRTRLDGETVYVCVTWGEFGRNFMLLQRWQVFKRRLFREKLNLGLEEDDCPYEISSWEQLISIIQKVCHLKPISSRELRPATKRRS